MIWPSGARRGALDVVLLCSFAGVIGVIGVASGCGTPSASGTRSASTSPTASGAPVTVVTRQDSSRRTGLDDQPTTAGESQRPPPTAGPGSDPIAVDAGSDPIAVDAGSGGGAGTDSEFVGDSPGESFEMGAEEAEKLARSYLRRLASRDLEDAEAACREIWEAPRETIPFLLREVESRTPTKFKSLRVIAFRPVGQIDEQEEVSYYVPGLGGVRFDDVAAGKSRSGKSYDVRLKRLKDSFPLGAVLRGALLNRFRSANYPPGDDLRNPRGWWQRYYERVLPTL